MLCFTAAHAPCSLEYTSPTSVRVLPSWETPWHPNSKLPHPLPADPLLKVTVPRELWQQDPVCAYH